MFNFLFPKVVPFMRKCEKILYSRVGRRLKYGRCALHAGYLKLQTHAQNMLYLMLFHCKNGCTKAH